MEEQTQSDGAPDREPQENHARSVTEATAPAVETAPITGQERVGLIDSYRGFAILGILMVNMAIFYKPIAAHMGFLNFPLEPIDEYAKLFIRFFFEAKFYVIFSFLFGVGMAVQAERFQATGRDFVPFFMKRMFWLLMIGLVHGVLIWSGDILVSYAIVGMFLTLFAKVQPKWLLRWAFVAFMIGFAFMGLVYLLFIGIEYANPEESLKMAKDQLAQHQALYDSGIKAYTEGSYMDAVKQRMTEYGTQMMSLMYTFFSIITNFLMGAYVWRKGALLNIGKYEKALKRWILYGGSLGLLANCLMMMKNMGTLMSELHLPALGLHFAQFGMGYSYLAILALLYHKGALRWLFEALAPVGRMAMTNYLSHSVIFTLIFYNYGFDLMETGIIGPFYGLILTFVMFISQIFISKWWLSKFRFGPMEWLWRSLTYGKLQSMKRS